MHRCLVRAAHSAGRRLTHVDEAVVEVGAGEAGEDARVGGAGLLDDAPHRVVEVRARAVVVRRAQLLRPSNREAAANVISILQAGRGILCRKPLCLFLTCSPRAAGMA
jgi:hypothetical protein